MVQSQSVERAVRRSLLDGTEVLFGWGTMIYHKEARNIQLVLGFGIGKPEEHDRIHSTVLQRAFDEFPLSEGWDRHTVTMAIVPLAMYTEDVEAQ